MTKIGLSFPLFKEVRWVGLTDSNLEKVVKLSEGIKEGRRNVEENYPNIGIRVTRGLDSEEAAYHVFLNGKGEQLTQATETLIESTGVPDFVYSGYKIVDQVLEKYNKKTKQKLSGLFIGRCVVDK